MQLPKQNSGNKTGLVSCKQFILLSFFFLFNPLHLVFLTLFLSNNVPGQCLILTLSETAVTSVPGQGFWERLGELPHALPWVNAPAVGMAGGLDLHGTVSQGVS